MEILILVIKSHLNNFKSNLLAVLIAMVLLLLPFHKPVSAQDSPVYPSYIVQSGDTLGSISGLFGVTVNEIIQFNNLTDPNKLAVGDVLKIPTFEGLNDTLTVQTVGLGENLFSLAISSGVNQSQLIGLNRLSSPSEIYAGTQLILPIQLSPIVYTQISSPSVSESPLEWGIRQGINPWSVAEINSLTTPSRTTPTIPLFMQSNKEEQASSFTPQIKAIEISPLPLQQGVTTIINVNTVSPISLKGKLGAHLLTFFQTGENQYSTLQGIEAKIEPGVYDFSIESEDGSIQFSQPILLVRINYGQGAPLDVDPRLIDPAVTEPEEQLVRKYVAPVNPEKYWDGPFQYPIDEPCVSAGYGSDREYNGGALRYYHTGMDFSVCANNLNIYAPAAGRVVFAGPLDVRGNSVILDHGHGVYSGFWHQTEMAVSVGDFLTAGQMIGLIGSTGRSTGPHLHWEIWVNGVQVNPYNWLVNNYP
jgi:murein DD-endopeptidase MepM/ murein hydrolase activator NlpD